MSVLTDIATALPDYKHKQKDIAGFMSDLLENPEEGREKLLTLYAGSGIDTRYSVLSDFSLPSSKRTFFDKGKDPSLEYRMKLYTDNALKLSLKAIRKCMGGDIKHKDITHIITVSCTGLYAPGLDIDIIQSLKLDENISRTSVNFMGCYAAIHAFKQADSICTSNKDAIVLIVCLELCTIHFQKKEDIDNITANLLFADGVGAALIVGDNVAKKKKLHGFGIKNFHSQVELKGKADMAWQLSSTGFLMTLSKYVPRLIESGIKNLFNKAIHTLKVKQQDITHWAIHPGGKKILAVIQKELGLKDADISSSRKVLNDYGNMSSATVLFVLKDIMKKKAKPKDLTYCVAFGPGLTMESVILENV
ncbi:MAG TPA: type III polyketide synthase [Bacteroidia bacterium]|jgi:predicted naringenin-chalcone synthase|nr:type III polyketide synthase [Bacteroidia bacterium]